MAEHKTPGTSHRTASLLAVIATVLLIVITAQIRPASDAKAAATQVTDRQIIATQAITPPARVSLMRIGPRSIQSGPRLFISSDYAGQFWALDPVTAKWEMVETK